MLQIISPDASIFQDFGFSVAMSQHYVVIGAPGDESTGVDGGKVYIYELDNDDGVLEVELDESFTPGSDDDFARFGTAVAIYEGTDDVQVPENSLSAWVAVGAPGSNTTGVVSVYAKIEDANDDDWTLLAEVKPPDTVPASGFGRAVAWYNDVLVRNEFIFEALVFNQIYINHRLHLGSITSLSLGLFSFTRMIIRILLCLLIRSLLKILYRGTNLASRYLCSEQGLPPILDMSLVLGHQE